MKRDSGTESFWEKEALSADGKQKLPTAADIVIVGAGITGITIGLELQKKGKKCLILEKDNPGFGSTGGTTAHLNNFFDSSYDEVISNFGEDGAKLLAKTAKKAVQYVKKNVSDYKIDCDFDECDFYLFSAVKKQDDMLDSIYKAHQKVDIETKQVSEIPFPLKFSKAIEIKGQAQFHPLKYIKGLLEEYTKLGGQIISGAEVSEYEAKEGKIEVTTSKGKMVVKQLIWATHIPPGNNRFNILVAPYRSYAMTVELEDAPKSLGQTADLYDPYHYIRYHKSGDKYYLIAGGFDHKTGDEKDTEKPFKDLKKYVDDNFTYKKVVATWSSQYYVPADGLPYIGQMPGEENVYIATGYNGNGMTFSTISAFIIPDLVDGKETDLTKLLSPGRVKPAASASSVVQEGITSAAHLVKDKITALAADKADEVKKGEGKIIRMDGESFAAYRDDKGKLHLLKPTCPHMGCNVLWNNAEKSWDCPCHGSRFGIEGELLNGPAMHPLEKAEVKK